MQINSSSKIIIEPIGGLCNRMRVIDSAIALSKANNSKLYVVWPLNAELNCRFEQLWTIPTSVHQINQVKKNSLLARSIAKLYRTKVGEKIQKYYLKRIVKSCDLVLTHNQMEIYKSENYQYCDFRKLTCNRRVYITTEHQFYHSDTHRPFKDFNLIPELQEVSDALLPHNNIIGVHIRRTDNTQSLQHSTTKRFIELMQSEVELDNDVSFFVATDSPMEEANLKLIFGSRIISLKKESLDRNEACAIQAAAIDLYCLSKCRKLIGSYYSSFTDTAHQIRNIEYIIAKS